MATPNEAAGRIYQDFATGWGATSPFTFDNENPKGFPPANAPWARVSVRHGPTNQESLGGVGRRKFERTGSVFVQCFAPLDGGRVAADTLAQVARTIFEGKTLTPENLHFTAVEIREIGPDEAWYQINVEAPFTYTETK